MGDFKDSNATTGAVANMDCSPCSELVLKEIRDKFKEITEDDDSTASEMMKHWLGASGHPINWRLKWLLDSNNDVRLDQVIDEDKKIYVNAIKKYFLNRPNEPWKEEYLYYRHGYSASWLSNAYHSFGSYQLYSRAVFKFKKGKFNTSIFATIEYIWYDKYDWNKNGQTVAGWWYGVDDDMGRRLTECGEAKAFDIYSIFYRTVKLTFTDYELETDSNLVYSKIQFGDIKEGNAPVNEIGTIESWREKKHEALLLGYTFTREGCQDNEPLPREYIFKNYMSDSRLESKDIIEKNEKFYEVLKSDHPSLSRSQFSELDTSGLGSTSLVEFEVPCFKEGFDDNAILFP